MPGQCAESVVGGRGEGGARMGRGRGEGGARAGQVRTRVNKGVTQKDSATRLCANTGHGTLIPARPANLAWMTSAAAEKD